MLDTNTHHEPRHDLECLFLLTDCIVQRATLLSSDIELHFANSQLVALRGLISTSPFDNFVLHMMYSMTPSAYNGHEQSAKPKDSP